MKRMPTGQYVPGGSVIHRLDARSKILCMFVLLASVISASSQWGFLFLLLVTGGIFILSRLPVPALLGSLGRLWLFFLVILLMNAFFFGDSDLLFSWWIFHVSREGIRQGILIILRVALIMALGNVLTCTTSPIEITGALESLMKPLKFLRIPAGEIAMIISVAIQFIPTLLEEADMVKKAQIARGARFESKKLTEKAASLLPLVIPIFLSAFRRADELSLAMEARGYRNAGSRTGKKPVPIGGRDVTALTFSTLVCLMLLFLF